MGNPIFHQPPVPTNPSGIERSAGYEFEFTGVKMADVAGIIKTLYGGTIRRISTYEYDVEGTEFGTFHLELDAQLLRDKKYESYLNTIGIDLTSFKSLSTIEERMKKLASSVVPFEIITPPLPISKMDQLDRLLDELRKLKAKGTGSSFFYAFGLHINPEIPDDSAESLLNHLRAYVLLDSWIRKDADINISRRLTPYINEYKEEYLNLILNESYSPDLRGLIRDYFRFENSRNRPLDMLPVFLHLDPDYTTEFLSENITSGRPTYHYRLPNCSIEDPGWTLADEWNRWILVEKLAQDKRTLSQYCSAWFKIKKDTLLRFEQKWIQLIDRWVKNDS